MNLVFGHHQEKRKKSLIRGHRPTRAVPGPTRRRPHTRHHRTAHCSVPGNNCGRGGKGRGDRGGGGRPSPRQCAQTHVLSGYRLAPPVQSEEVSLSEESPQATLRSGGTHARFSPLRRMRPSPPRPSTRTAHLSFPGTNSRIVPILPLRSARVSEWRPTRPPGMSKGGAGSDLRTCLSNASQVRQRASVSLYSHGKSRRHSVHRRLVSLGARACVHLV